MPGRGGYRHLLAAGSLLFAGCGGQGGEGFIAPAPEEGTAVVLMQPAVEPVAPGQDVEVSVQILDALDAVSVPFKLRYDARYLEFQGGTQGPFMQDGDGQLIFLATAAGDTVSVGLALVGATEGVSGDGELCRLRFRVLPSAMDGDEYLSLIPFASQVYASGLQEMPSEFRPLRLRLRDRSAR